MTYTVRLTGPTQREYAKRLIAAAPDYAVVTVKAGDRTLDQNAKMHAMLSDISRAKPRGLKHTPDVWKALMMKACGHAVQFVNGIDGEPFPIGFKSSRLSKSQMSDLIEFMYQFGSENGIIWSNETGFLDGQEDSG
jgi:hypothetical protein